MENVLDVEKLKSMTQDQRNQVIQGIRQQAMIAQLQSLVTEASDKCLTKCITAPGTTLSGGEKQCLQRCMDRFMETYEAVSKSLHQRLQNELANNPSSPMLSSQLDFSSGPTFS